MKLRHRPLFAEASDPTQVQSGGRGSAKAPTGSPKASVGVSPADLKDLKAGVFVTLCFAKGASLKGFKDPVLGFMNADGVKLPKGNPPTGWLPL